MIYKVLIPTAGTGSRLLKETENINKSLVLINNKPIISYIIEKFPLNIEIVIALGYKGDLVKQYLNIAHPKNKFKFVNVSKYTGKDSGLGLSIYECKTHLQCPFIFFSCDTFIQEKKIPLPNKNWIGYSNTYNPKLYRTIGLKKNKLTKIYNKQKKGGNFDYIGLSGIYDYRSFWKTIDKSKNVLLNGEIEGLNAIKEKKIFGYKFRWSDCGSLKSLNKLRNEKLKSRNEAIILPKEDEFIAFVKNRVIKFHKDENFIKKRVSRQTILKKFTPNITSYSRNYYSYKKINAKLFSVNNSQKNFVMLLKYLQLFWKKKKLNQKDLKNFYYGCNKFYKHKTLNRLDLFFKTYRIKDKPNFINQTYVPNITKLFKMIDWTNVCKGIPSNYHGDLHFENILSSKSKFYLLDWRQDFSNNLKFGDIYYDFAKLLHGMIVSHKIVHEKKFKIISKDEAIVVKIQLNKNNLNLIKIFKKWIIKNEYDYKKTRIICGLIYLNIAPLHHYPYSIFLFYLGKLVIYNALNNKNKIL